MLIELTSEDNRKVTVKTSSIIAVAQDTNKTTTILCEGDIAIPCNMSYEEVLKLLRSALKLDLH